MKRLLIGVAIVSPFLSGPIVEARNRTRNVKPAWHWFKREDGGWSKVWGTRLPDGTIHNPQYERPTWPFG